MCLGTKILYSVCSPCKAKNLWWEYNAVLLLLPLPLPSFCTIPTPAWVQYTARVLWHHFFPEITPTDFFFFFYLIYWGNIYSLFILLWVMFCLSLLLPPLPPASPQTQVLCNAADEDPVLELEYQLPWESNEKQHEKVTSVVKCPYTLLMRKYKASVDFAELIRNNDLDPDFPSPSEARDWSPYISWNVRKLTCHLAWIKRTICRLRYPQSWSDHAWNG